MNEFEEIALELRRRKKINMWGIDISLLEDGVYHGDITAPIDIKEFKGFKEEFKLGINEVRGSLTFYECTSLTSIGVLPQKIGNLNFSECHSLTSVGVLPKIIGGYLFFSYCESLTSIGVLPEKIGGDLSFYECKSLTSIEQLPKVVNGAINTYSTTFFEDMTEEQIREKYGIKYE